MNGHFWLQRRLLESYHHIGELSVNPIFHQNGELIFRGDF
jgi:hypothetical protein